MSEEQTLSEVVESDLASNPQPGDLGTDDFDSPEYINQVAAEFRDTLGLGAREQAPETEKPAAETQQETQATPGEQAGATNTPEPGTIGEALAKASEPEETDPAPDSKSQEIERRANAEAAKRNSEQAHKQALEEARAEAAKQAREEMYRELRLKPQEWIRAAKEQGLNPGEMAMIAYHEALGDKSPPELKQRVDQILGRPDNILSEVERKFAEQERRFEERQRQLELKQIALGYEEYLANVPESEPYLKAAVKANRDAVKQNMFSIADAYAQQHGRYPSASQLTAEYNRQVKEILELHGINTLTSNAPTPAAETSSPKAAAPTNQTTTLSEGYSDRAHGAPEEEDLSDEALERAAIDWLRSQPAPSDL